MFKNSNNKGGFWMLANRLVVAAMAGGLLLLSAEASAARPIYRVHYSLVAAAKPKLPKKLIVLPVNIQVKERTYGGVSEVVDKWSEQASRNIFRALGNYAKSNKSMSLVRTPNFTSSQNSRITEHLALYRKVVNAASWATRTQPVWEHKLKKFDYTIGSGLNFIRNKTGADTALLVYGEDEVLTAGAAAATVASKIFGGTRQFGQSYIHLGLVDLRTGNILWLNSAYKGASGDLRTLSTAKQMVNEIFEDYPGIKQYRSAYVN
jgi:hypothetical protein